MKRVFLAPVLGLAALTPHAAMAEVPGPVRAMIEKAQETDDVEAMQVLIDLADETFPGNADELNTIMANFRQRVAAKTAVAQKQEAEAKEQEIRSAGLLDNWQGQGQLGAFRSTGNTSDTGVTAGVTLERVGIDWRHKLTGLVDYQKSNGVTTREQFLAAYEANYDLSDRLYGYGLVQYERDVFQGYTARYSASGGLGYRVIENDNMQLSVKAGPAYRKTDFNDGSSESGVAGLAALDFDWQIAENLKLTEDASAFIQSGGNTYVSTTGLVAGLGSGFSASVSYSVEHETNPPVGAVKTDTLTRATLIYDF